MSINKDKNDKQEQNETSISESAINKKEVDGKAVNPQQKERREIHQPRDNA